MDDTESPATNVSSDLWADAIATLTKDEGEIERAAEIVRIAKKRRKENLKLYSERGIPTPTLLDRYAETLMSEDERHQLYAMEAMSRRALDFWSAETPEDFNQLLERAVSTPPASEEHLEKMAGERAFNDGYNGALKGGQTEIDNPHIYGTLKYTRWLAGCSAAMEKMNAVPARLPLSTKLKPAEVAAIEDEVQREMATQTSRPRKAPRKQPAPVVKQDQAPADGLFPATPEMPV